MRAAVRGDSASAHDAARDRAANVARSSSSAARASAAHGRSSTRRASAASTRQGRAGEAGQWLRRAFGAGSRSAAGMRACGPALGCCSPAGTLDREIFRLPFMAASVRPHVARLATHPVTQRSQQLQHISAAAAASCPSDPMGDIPVDAAVLEPEPEAGPEPEPEPEPEPGSPEFGAVQKVQLAALQAAQAVLTSNAIVRTMSPASPPAPAAADPALVMLATSGGATAPAPAPPRARSAAASERTSLSDNVHTHRRARDVDVRASAAR